MMDPTEMAPLQVSLSLSSLTPSKENRSETSFAGSEVYPIWIIDECYWNRNGRTDTLEPQTTKSWTLSPPDDESRKGASETTKLVGSFVFPLLSFSTVSPLIASCVEINQRSQPYSKSHNRRIKRSQRPSANLVTSLSDFQDVLPSIEPEFEEPSGGGEDEGVVIEEEEEYKLKDGKGREKLTAKKRQRVLYVSFHTLIFRHWWLIRCRRTGAGQVNQRGYLRF